MLIGGFNRPAGDRCEANRRRTALSAEDGPYRKHEPECEAWIEALSALKGWAILSAVSESVGCKAIVSLAMKGGLRPRRMYVRLPAELGRSIKSLTTVTVLECAPNPGQNDRV